MIFTSTQPRTNYLDPKLTEHGLLEFPYSALRALQVQRVLQDQLGQRELQAPKVQQD